MGTRLTSKGTVATLASVVGVDDGGSVARQTVANLSTQLAASGALADAIADIADATAFATIVQATWTGLSAIAGTGDGQGAEVLASDEGTHDQATATGYDGDSVANAGRYTWVEAWSRWLRIGSTGLATVEAALADKADAADAALTGDATAENLAVSGTLTAPTAAPGTDSTVVATTEFVVAAIGSGGTDFNDVALTGNTSAENLAVTDALDVTGATLTLDDGQIPVAKVDGAADQAALDAAVADVDSRLLDTMSTTIGESVRIQDAATRPFFPIAPQYCFVEESITATTRAGVGDAVGCIKDVTGAFYLVSSGTQGVLRVDGSGNYYIDTTDAAYRVLDATGERWSPGATWAFIGGFQGPNGPLFGWTRDNAQVSVKVATTDNTGFRVTARAADNTTDDILKNTHSSLVVPHVLTVVKSTTDIAAYYDDDPERGASAVAPFDDSGEVLQAVLFSGRAGTVSASYDGRCYGMAWAAGDVTAADLLSLKRAMIERTKPAALVLPDGNPALLDFDRGLYQWRGRDRVLADLTDNGGGSYTLTDMAWWREAFTVVLDVETDMGAGGWSGTLWSLTTEDTGTWQIEPNPNDTNERLNLFSPGLTGSTDGVTTQDVNIGVRPTGTVRKRFAFLVEPGKQLRVEDQRLIEAQTGGAPARGHAPTAMTVDTAVTGWTLHRAKAYPGVLARDDLWQAMREDRVAIHCLGDSFVDWGQQDFNAQIYTLLADNLNCAGALMTHDAAGGKQFYEPLGDGHAARFERTPWHWNKILVISDGGFSAQDDESVQIALQRILSHAARDANDRAKYVFMEPNPITALGQGSRDRWIARVSDLRNLTFEVASPRNGNRYAATMEAMFCLEDGSPEDRADVADGIWPGSASSDGTHYLAPGRVLYAKAAVALMRDEQWLVEDDGTTPIPATAAPGAVTSLSASGAVITWAPPTDDGGWPIKGYEIERDNGGAWDAQTPQGSPSGTYYNDYDGDAVTFDLQYIHEWTAPASDDYRIRAVTDSAADSGRGPWETVTVTV